MINEIKDKHLVETQIQAIDGIGLQFLKEKNGKSNYIVLEGKVYRINAPEDSGCYPLILWTMDGPNDNIPSAEKFHIGTHIS